MSDYDTLSIKIDLETCYETIWENLKILYGFSFPNHKKLCKSKQLKYIDDLYESNIINEYLKDELITALSKYQSITLTAIKKKGIEHSNKDVEYLKFVNNDLCEQIVEIEKIDYNKFVRSIISF